MDKDDDLAALLAHELAQMDGMDEDGLFELRWSGGTCPEPLGDAWNMDYLPKANGWPRRWNSMCECCAWRWPAWLTSGMSTGTTATCTRP